jgi:hypothetical protein
MEFAMRLRRFFAIAALLAVVPLVSVATAIPNATAADPASASASAHIATTPHAASKTPAHARSCTKRSRLGHCERWSRPRSAAASAAAGHGR